MSILQKYILREWFWATLAVSIVLIVVILGAYLGDMLRDVAGGKMPAGLLSMLTLLYIPATLGNILPLAGFVAVMWGLGRLYQDQEMAVMRSSGFGWTHLIRPLFRLMLPLAALLLVLGWTVAPSAARMAEQSMEQAFRSAAVWGLQPGKFHMLRDGELVIYVESVEEDGTTLRNIFIKQTQQQREQVWVAQNGRYWVDYETGERFLILENGKVTGISPGHLDLSVLDFARNDLRLPEPEFHKREQRAKSRPSADLLADGSAQAIAELQWRLSPAFSVIVLGLLAIPLTHLAPREGRGSRIVLGILVYLLYGNILFLCQSWVAAGVLPTWVGLWWVHIIFLLISVIWIHRQGRFSTRASAPSM